MADYIIPTPRNPILGLLADAMMGGLSWMDDPRRTQQMRGVGGLLSDTGIAQTLDRLASGEPLTKGKGFATQMKPETANAVMTLAPEAVPIGRAAMAGVRATKGLPVGLSIKDISKSEIQSSADFLAEQLKNLGFQAKVIHSGSRAGPSSYVEIYDPSTGRVFDKPVRFSGHSKGVLGSAGVYDIQDVELDSQKIIDAANKMRLLGPSQGFKFQEALDAKANELIANGMKPRTAYNSARKFLEDQDGLLSP